MIILDTDALSHMQKPDPVGVRINTQLDNGPDRDIRITAVSTYEMLGGSVALIDRRKKDRRDLSVAFSLHHDLVEYLGNWQRRILPYDAMAEQIYKASPARLRQELKNDARIAAIALMHGSTVWTCNVTHYASVPGLTVVRAETGSRIS